MLFHIDEVKIIELFEKEPYNSMVHIQVVARLFWFKIVVYLEPKILFIHNRVHST
jgi:hypothetical protein